MGVALPEMSPWNRRTLTIPPNSVNAWIRLAIWELWMGMLVSVVLGLGVLLVTTAPTHIVAVTDLTNCYATPPVPQPCDRILYRGGALNVAFTALCGLMLIGVALWLLWELWSAAAPKPITDDFLKLLNDSFGRRWHTPSTWPWARMLWAYGFALLGGTLTAGVALMVATLLASTPETTTPRIDTFQTFRLGASPAR